jgi:HAD superfamily hydrolase (TIGR01509 family)
LIGEWNRFRPVMQDFDLIIFDCDGVVVDSEILSCGCLRTMLQRHEIAIELPEIYDRFLGRGFRAVADQYVVWRGTPMPESFRAELEALARQSFSAELHPMPGITELLRRIDTDYCLASSSDLSRIELCLSVTRLSGLFAGRLFSAQMVANGKPAPDLFLHAAKTMGARPERTLVIEDSAIGVAAGRAAGMTVWGFVGGGHYRDRDGRSLLAASGAAQVFDRMADLQAQLTD